MNFDNSSGLSLTVLMLSFSPSFWMTMVYSRWNTRTTRTRVRSFSSLSVATAITSYALSVRIAASPPHGSASSVSYNSNCNSIRLTRPILTRPILTSARFLESITYSLTYPARKAMYPVTCLCRLRGIFGVADGTRTRDT